MSRQARVGAVVALGVVLGTLLIFAGLSQRYLWDDEAETALLAERVLQFGVPLAWDGASLVSQECGQDYDQNYVWRQTPWLPIYVAAASFKLFGVSTTSGLRAWRSICRRSMWNICAGVDGTTTCMLCSAQS